MKKRDLWMLAIALVSLVFIAIVFVAAGTSKSDTPDDTEEVIALNEEVGPQQEESSVQTEEAEEGSGESPSESADKGSAFAFSVDGFSEKFAGNLPQGYIFAESITANPLRDNRMQLDILDESGTSTDIAIMFDTEKAKLNCSQMALTIKEDCFEDDADAILKWYVFNFLEGFTEEKKKAIYDDYLYMFDTGSEEFRVYSEEALTVMMCRETEEAGNYYYVMVSTQ